MKGCSKLLDELLVLIFIGLVLTGLVVVIGKSGTNIISNHDKDTIVAFIVGASLGGLTGIIVGFYMFSMANPAMNFGRNIRLADRYDQRVINHNPLLNKEPSKESIARGEVPDFVVKFKNAD